MQIGNSKQLFIDDEVIGSLEYLHRTIHGPRRFSGNPILTGTEPWERGSVEVNGRSVLFDDERQEFRMWYGSPLYEDAAPSGIRYKVCYATSQDGIHFNRINLGQVAWEGSRQNNILRWGENWMRRPNVIKDLHEVDSQRRFKMTYVDVIDGKPAITKAYSPDGIQWRLNGDGRPWFRQAHNSNLLGWYAPGRQYVFFPRMPGSQNAVGRATSPDFILWSEPQTVLAPGPADQGCDFKGLAAFAYEGLYLGFLWVFVDLRHAAAELAVSRDTVTWQRVAPGTYFFPQGEPGTWDAEVILPVAPVIYANQIWIYYSGSNLPYATDAAKQAQMRWGAGERRDQWAIGLAHLRLDGFVSLDAGEASGTLRTKAFELPPGSLYVNADVRGEIRVELQDEHEHPLPGFSLSDSRPVHGDSLRHQVRWRDDYHLAGLQGKPVKLRFRLQGGSLYGFWFA